MNQATLLKRLPAVPSGTPVVGTANQGLFRCDPPLAGHEFVVASANTVCGRPETYLFPADESGQITGWSELPGSLKDTLDWGDAFGSAGYEVAS